MARGTSGEYLIFTWQIPDFKKWGLPPSGIFTTIKVNKVVSHTKDTYYGSPGGAV